MRTISGNLLAHLQEPVTTLCLCFKITREDGQIFRFTGHDRSLTIGGETYVFNVSFSSSQMDSKSGLSVDNAELTLPLVSGYVTKTDVIAGLFYRSSLDVFWVNWNDVTMGVIYEAKGWRLGKAILKEHKVIFEVRSLASFLNAPIVDVISPDCPYVFGLNDDYRSHCPANLDSYKSTGSTTSVDTSEPQRIFTDSGRGETSNVYSYGKITWTSGNNSGYSMEIENYNTSTKQITLLFDMPYPIEVGDAYDIWQGCDKSWTRCNSLGYQLDFGGEPYVPSKDKALQYEVNV